MPSSETPKMSKPLDDDEMARFNAVIEAVTSAPDWWHQGSLLRRAAKEYRELRASLAASQRDTERPIYIVEQPDYDYTSQFAAFSTKGAAEAFIAKGPESGRDALEVTELALDPVGKGCFYREVKFPGMTLGGGGWSYYGQLGTVGEWGARARAIYGATQEEADENARQFITAPSPTGPAV